MSYLNAVCRKVLRLLPPVAVTIRVAVKDTSICGQPIPTNTTIMIPPRAVNGSTGLDAGDFDRERWRRNANDNHSDNKRTVYDFLASPHGPRSCIGKSFAIGKFACLLAAWVCVFETHSLDPTYVPVIKGLTAKSKDGLQVRLKPLIRTWLGRYIIE